VQRKQQKLVILGASWFAELLEGTVPLGFPVRHLAFHLRYALTNKVGWTIVEVTVVKN